jgi:hypothetical protein
MHWTTAQNDKLNSLSWVNKQSKKQTKEKHKIKKFPLVFSLSTFKYEQNISLFVTGNDLTFSQTIAWIYFLKKWLGVGGYCYFFFFFPFQC